MSITGSILSVAAPLPKIEEFQRFLFIGPHPDDIEIGAGATAARLAAAGKDVVFLICTDGRFGTDQMETPAAPEDLILTRRAEALLSAERLGVKDVRFLALCDGGFYAQEDLVCGIARVMSDFRPQIIFAPDPDVRSECHIDHLNVGRAAKQLAVFSGNPGIMARFGAQLCPVDALALYMTAAPNRLVKTDGCLPQQLEALFTAHLSQFPEGGKAAGSIRLYLKLRAYEFGLRRLCRSAEGFRVLGPTQMHCLPEADPCRARGVFL